MIPLYPINKRLVINQLRGPWNPWNARMPLKLPTIHLPGRTGGCGGVMGIDGN